MCVISYVWLCAAQWCSLDKTGSVLVIWPAYDRETVSVSWPPSPGAFELILPMYCCLKLHTNSHFISAVCIKDYLLNNIHVFMLCLKLTSKQFRTVVMNVAQDLSWLATPDYHVTVPVYRRGLSNHTSSSWFRSNYYIKRGEKEMTCCSTVCNTA